MLLPRVTVCAVLDQSRAAAYHACLLDPLNRSVGTLDQLRALWEAEGSLLNHFYAN